MSSKPTPQGLSLCLILAGALVIMGAAGILTTGGGPVWRFVVAGGGIVQFAGWLLHRRGLRRQRGGAA
ncbi:hypothetical protein [Streptomyces alboflavus]|uniref:hypothetical protein n=1 Tax=Streptomyces alboflavus TaxID=67267 RepID=UPI0036C3313A